MAMATRAAEALANRIIHEAEETMHIEIHETMRGWLQKEGEARIPFAFELVTHSSELFGVTAPRPSPGKRFWGGEGNLPH